MSLSMSEAARRVVADLMPIAIVVAHGGEAGEAACLAAALRAAGADADMLGPDTPSGFDLAVLCAAPDPAHQDGVAALIERLAGISDRLLFVPSAGAEAPPLLDAWFELFAEHGYQPVVEYDAGFLARGAFLVDRNATAAESELAAFADRLSLGGALAASTERVAVLEAELGSSGDRSAIKAELARGVAELAQARADEAEWRRAAELLGQWVRAVCTARRRRLLPWRPGGGKARLPEDFDAAWYIASQPDLAASGGDPVEHYRKQRK